MTPEKITYSAALSAGTHHELMRHFARTDGQEDLCFALWYPSDGTTRKAALLYRLVLPQPGERRVHGNASFLPGYFERAVAEAAAEDAGLAFRAVVFNPSLSARKPSASGLTSPTDHFFLARMRSICPRWFRS
jgi:hypothetical protein